MISFANELYRKVLWTIITTTVIGWASTDLFGNTSFGDLLSLIAKVMMILSIALFIKWAWEEINASWENTKRAMSITHTSLLMDQAKNMDKSLAELVLNNPQAMSLDILLGKEMDFPQLDINIVGMNEARIPLEFVTTFIAHSGKVHTLPIRTQPEGRWRQMAKDLVDTMEAAGWVGKAKGNQSAPWRLNYQDVTLLFRPLDEIVAIQQRIAFTPTKETRLDLG